MELDDNLALYDDVGRILILLNASAASVWELCDGTATLDDMVRTLIDSHAVDAGSTAFIPADVRQTVRKLAELGLVVDAGEAAEADADEEDDEEEDEVAAGG